ncbi:hypothetical protein D9757_010302 [Collybiopsis confluens]|uniref:Ribosomal RNA methyltransferase FtsJ domain-containing protein n=1 Tax=Collybiopsis confluens TaxID=2823264 RepID=A0A8H5LVK0_9AGAR|nr:hypothetical protein D9757_010302 [Collybiopsis confluens]
MPNEEELHSIHLNTVSCWENDNLQHLKNLKRMAQANHKFRDHIHDQRELADNPTPELQNTWLKKMKKIMNQIDNCGAADKLWVVPFTNRSFRFLDLGCCPGGFSTYILKKNKQATSVGISLDPEQGGHPYLLEESLRPRQTVIFADITRFQLGGDTSYVADPMWQAVNGQPLLLVPDMLLARDFDLVLLDAHHLRNQAVFTADLLAISQVLLALLSIKFGGTIVMKLASPDSQYTATMLFMLDMLSSSLQVHKPYAMHRTQNTFYVIARGVAGKPDRRLYLLNELLPGLKRVWENLRVGNNTVSGKSRKLLKGDLDFVIDGEQLQGYGQRLHELCSGVWELQASALETRSLNYDSPPPPSAQLGVSNETNMEEDRDQGQGPIGGSDAVGRRTSGAHRHPPPTKPLQPLPSFSHNDDYDSDDVHSVKSWNDVTSTTNPIKQQSNPNPNPNFNLNPESAAPTKAVSQDTILLNQYRCVLARYPHLTFQPMLDYEMDERKPRVTVTEMKKFKFTLERGSSIYDHLKRTVSWFWDPDSIFYFPGCLYTPLPNNQHILAFGPLSQPIPGFHSSSSTFGHNHTTSHLVRSRFTPFYGMTRELFGKRRNGIVYLGRYKMHSLMVVVPGGGDSVIGEGTRIPADISLEEIVSSALPTFPPPPPGYPTYSQLREMYRTGTLKVECVALQMVDYDENLYRALKRGQMRKVPPKPKSKLKPKLKVDKKKKRDKVGGGEGRRDREVVQG